MRRSACVRVSGVHKVQTNHLRARARPPRDESDMGAHEWKVGWVSSQSEA